MSSTDDVLKNTNQKVQKIIDNYGENNQKNLKNINIPRKIDSSKYIFDNLILFKKYISFRLNTFINYFEESDSVKDDSIDSYIPSTILKSRIKDKRSLKEKIYRKKIYNKSINNKNIYTYIDDLIGFSIITETTNEIYIIKKSLLEFLKKEKNIFVFDEGKDKGYQFNLKGSNLQYIKIKCYLETTDSKEKVFFEIQIKSHLSSIYSNIEHSLIYKNRILSPYKSLSSMLINNMGSIIPLIEENIDGIKKQLNDNNLVVKNEFQRILSKEIVNNLKNKKHIDSKYIKSLINDFSDSIYKIFENEIKNNEDPKKILKKLNSKENSVSIDIEDVFYKMFFNIHVKNTFYLYKQFIFYEVHGQEIDPSRLDSILDINYFTQEEQTIFSKAFNYFLNDSVELDEKFIKGIEDFKNSIQEASELKESLEESKLKESLEELSFDSEDPKSPIDILCEGFDDEISKFFGNWNKYDSDEKTNYFYNMLFWSKISLSLNLNSDRKISKFPDLFNKILNRKGE